MAGKEPRAFLSILEWVELRTNRPIVLGISFASDSFLIFRDGPIFEKDFSFCSLGDRWAVSLRSLAACIECLLIARIRWLPEKALRPGRGNLGEAGWQKVAREMLQKERTFRGAGPP